VITVRLPASCHAILIEASHREQTSMNKLCIGRLLRAELVQLEAIVAEQNDPQTPKESEQCQT